MYRIVDENGNVYVKFPYTKEGIFERTVCRKNTCIIFCRVSMHC